MCDHLLVMAIGLGWSVLLASVGLTSQYLRKVGCGIPVLYFASGQQTLSARFVQISH